MTPDWKPTDHQTQASKYFEDFRVGDTYTLPSRTQTSGIFTAFQAASADNDPIHYDVEHCRRRGHPDMLAHGMQVLIQSAAGAGAFPREVVDSLIAMLELSASFVAPVYRGDTLYPLLEISELHPQNTTGVVTMKVTIRNQDGAVVMTGTHKYLLRKRDSA